MQTNFRLAFVKIKIGLRIQPNVTGSIYVLNDLISELLILAEQINSQQQHSTNVSTSIIFTQFFKE